MRTYSCEGWSALSKQVAELSRTGQEVYGGCQTDGQAIEIGCLVVLSRPSAHSVELWNMSCSPLLFSGNVARHEEPSSSILMAWQVKRHRVIDCRMLGGLDRLCWG